MMSREWWFELIVVTIGGIAIFLLGQLFLRELQPIETTSKENAGAKAAISKLETAPGTKLQFRDYRELTDRFPGFPWRTLPQVGPKDATPVEEDQAVRSALIESSVLALEKRVDNLEGQKTSPRAIGWAALIWILTTFLSPVVGCFGKRTFGMKC